MAGEIVKEYRKSEFRSEEEREEMRQQLAAFAPAIAAFVQESDVMFRRRIGEARITISGGWRSALEPWRPQQ